MKKIIKLTALFLVLTFVFSTFSFAQTAVAMPEMNEYGFVDCGDVKIEYGIYVYKKALQNRKYGLRNIPDSCRNNDNVRFYEYCNGNLLLRGEQHE